MDCQHVPTVALCSERKTRGNRTCSLVRPGKVDGFTSGTYLICVGAGIHYRLFINMLENPWDYSPGVHKNGQLASDLSKRVQLQ